MTDSSTRQDRTIRLDDPISGYWSYEFVTLRQDCTTAEAIEQLRSRPLSDKIMYLYVVNEQSQLTGVVPVRRLITADPAARMETVMIRPVQSISSQSTLRQACELFVRHRFLALPVVDAENHILGVVDVTVFSQGAVTLQQHQQVENLFQLIGMHMITGQKTTPWASFKDRFPWLLCNMASGLLCAWIAWRYEGLVRQVAMLAMFIPLVLAMGESVSMQAMTLTLHYLAHGRLSWRRAWKMTLAELATAAMLGLACAAILIAVAMVWCGQPIRVLAIGCSLLLAILTACLVGMAIPTGIRLFRVDPKVAAGPIVLALTDVMTLVYYFGLISWWAS
jgi:magnesium transporter